MLTIEQKAAILAKAGRDVPPFPRSVPVQLDALPGEDPESVSKRQAMNALEAGELARWKHEIEVMFSYYTAARAARSLREAESAKQMAMLRQAKARLS